MLGKLGFDISGVGAFLTTKIWMLQRTFNWQLLMPHDFEGIVGILVSQYCQDVEFGDYSITEIASLRHGAFERFYAGMQTIDVVTLTFLAPIDNSVTDYFHAWYNKMISEEGFYSPKQEYRRDIYAVLYDRTGIESAKFKLKGAFPISRIPRIRAAYGEDDVLRLSFSLRVDDIEMSSLIGSIREGVTNLLSPVYNQAKGVLGIVEE
jgi:hypothetical protein